MLGGGSCLLVAVVGPADLVRGWLWWRGRRKSQIASLNSNSYYGCVCVRVTRGRGGREVSFTEIRNKWGRSWASRQDCLLALELREASQGPPRHEEVMEAVAYMMNL